MRERLYIPEALGMTEEQERQVWVAFELLGDAAGVGTRQAAEATLRLWGHMIAQGRCRDGRAHEVDARDGRQAAGAAGRWE